jgi:hypothetical protein
MLFIVFCSSECTLVHLEDMMNYHNFFSGVKYRMFQKELTSDIPNVTVWRVSRKHLHLKAYNLAILQCVERWIVCTPFSVNFFVTLATQ